MTGRGPPCRILANNNQTLLSLVPRNRISHIFYTIPILESKKCSWGEMVTLKGKWFGKYSLHGASGYVFFWKSRAMISMMFLQGAVKGGWLGRLGRGKQQFGRGVKKKKNNLATLKWWKYPAKNNAAPETKTWDGKTWICLSFGGVMVSFSWHHVTLYTGCLPEDFFYMVQICVWVICVCLFLKGRFVLKKEHLQHLLDFWRPKNYWGTWS